MISKIPGVLLAGGKSRRMGGQEKCLLKLAGRTLLDHVIGRARPQVDTLILNAPGDAARFASYGLEVLPDVIEGYAGPLAGVLTGLDWAAANRPKATHMATFPCDAPFFPKDLIERLQGVLEDADIALATSGGREHPVFALWPLETRDVLRQALIKEGLRRLQDWTVRYKVARVNFETVPTDPFHNINTPKDLEDAERIVLAGHPG